MVPCFLLLFRARVIVEWYPVLLSCICGLVKTVSTKSATLIIIQIRETLLYQQNFSNLFKIKRSDPYNLCDLQVQ